MPEHPKGYRIVVVCFCSLKDLGRDIPAVGVQVLVRVQKRMVRVVRHAAADPENLLSGRIAKNVRGPVLHTVLWVILYGLYLLFGVYKGRGYGLHYDQV